MNAADRILELLYERLGGWFALAELCAAAGVDRQVLDESLDELRRRGQMIESSPQGVRLAVPVRLDSFLIERDLGTRRVGRSVLCFAEVDSTNDVALDAARQADADGLAVLAESQRRGRGRLGRRWLSPSYENILLSVLLVEPPDRGRQRMDALTIASGLAAAEAVERAVGLSCHLRWPNDVLLDGAKLAGVLVETRRHGRRLGIALGIGINANSAPPPDDVDQPAACLAERLGGPVERIEIIRELLRRLDDWVERTDQGQYEGLRAAFLTRCRMVNERITILCDGVRHTGRVLDVDPLRGLALCHDDGATIYLPAARSSVMLPS